MQRSRITGGRVLSRGSRRPPQMCEGHDPIACANQGRDILWGMSRRLHQANGSRELIAFRAALLPAIALIDGPVIVETSMPKQGRVEGMIGMVMGEDHISDRGW